MAAKTPLHPAHLAAGAKMAPFAGWEMPMHYGSQIREHHAVRTDAGVFDVSHMQIADLRGPGAAGFLRRLLANDAARLRAPGRALYSCMLNAVGGVMDDLIVYRLHDDAFRLVLNAGCAAKDLTWMRRQMQGFEAELEAREGLGLLAVQGPQAVRHLHALLPAGLQPGLKLPPFHACTAGRDWMAARTGYTGEDGFEIMLPAAAATGLWRALLGRGVQPCGLGARDTLRLEAGLNLFGRDMDETVTPLECGLAWTLAWEPADRGFIGRAALETEREKGGLPRFMGLIMAGRGVLRDGQRVWAGDAEAGVVTSGGFSPTLNRAIALARLAPEAGADLSVDIRGKRVPVQAVKPPFVRRGEPTPGIE